MDPTPPSSPLPPEALLQHADFLRALARSLIADPWSAEDAAQDVWVTALRTPPREQSNLRGWLATVLRRVASHAERHKRRRADREAASAPAAESPSVAKVVSEESVLRHLTEAVLALDEPYRRVVLQRYYAGKSSAEIARAEGVPAGTVRSRLKRALDMLRTRMDEGGGDRGAWCAGVLAFLGEEAVVKTALAGGPVYVGGIVMTKKIVLAVLVVVAVAAVSAWYAWSAPGLAKGDPRSSDRAVRQPASTPDAARDVASALIAATPESASRTGVEGATPAARVPLRGRVIDSASGQPIAGALVELHPPLRRNLHLAKEEAWAHSWKHNGGGAFFFPELRPSLADEDLVWSDAVSGSEEELLVFYDCPPEGSEPVTAARTDERGEFRLSAPAEGGTLRCAHEGYASRLLPAPDPSHAWTIAMTAPRPLFGRVVDTNGEPIAQELTLLFLGSISSRAMGRETYVELYGENRAAILYPLDMALPLPELPIMDSWPVVTEPDGTFEVELPTDEVHVWVRTPGFIAPLNRPWQTGTDEPAVVRVQRAPVLHVTDAETGAGIEEFSILGRNAAEGNPMETGRHFAPGGIYSLVRVDVVRDLLTKQPFDLEVWADGYMPARFHFTDLPSEWVVEAALVRGEVPALEGLVLEDGDPIPGARAALRACDPMQWRVGNRDTVAVCPTDRDGRFRLEAAAGRYLLRLTTGDHEFVAAVEVPGPTPTIIDFVRLGTIEVVIRDVDGKPQSECMVALRDATGRRDWRRTEADGHAVFADLPVGSYRIVLGRSTTASGAWDDVPRDVSIVAGAHELVEIELTTRGSEEPRYPRVVTEATVDFAGWRATSGTDWLSIRGDGTIPIDLQGPRPRTYEIADPHDQRWRVSVPGDAEDGYEIRVSVDGPRYEGLLLDLATEEPLAGIRVRGEPMGDEPAGTTTPSVVTDGHGRFVLRCGEPVPHRLTFSDDPSRPTQSDRGGVYEGLGFFPAATPGAPATIAIRLPRGQDGAFHGLGLRTLSGRVVFADDGEPLVRGHLYIRGLHAEENGTLELRTAGSGTLLGPDGRYEVLLPDVARYRVDIRAPNHGARLLLETWDASAGSTEVRDFAIRRE